MLYRHIITHCLPHLAKDVIPGNNFESLKEQTPPVIKRLKTAYTDGKTNLFHLPGQRDDLQAMQEVADRIASRFKHLVILGTGGSTLNGQVLTSLTCNSTAPKLHFMDNVDPHSFTLFLKTIDLASTAFLPISKSGKTVETLAQTLICLQAVKEAALPDIGKRFFIISDPLDNPMRRLGESIGATIMDHEPQIGGRFAAFTNVALIPAMVAGLDASLFRQGARAVIEQHFNTDTIGEAAIGAALAISLMQGGYSISVMMPYIDRLANFSSWYRQMWAESLGKNGRGSTPIKAMGTVDQHSQLQLYLDGPRDKLITFIALNTAGQGPRIEQLPNNDPSLSYIVGKTLGDIIAAEQQATENTLASNGCPVRTFRLDRLDEEIMGALLMHFMLETVITAELLTINAYDQPAVEEGKILTRKLLEETF